MILTLIHFLFEIFQGKTVRQNSIHSSPILSTINPMETLAEVDESKETSPIGPSGSPGPPFASSSSSSASPNSSVQVNRPSSIKDHQQKSFSIEQTTVTNDNNKDILIPNNTQNNHLNNDTNNSSSNNTNNNISCNNVDNIIVVNNCSEIRIDNNSKPLNNINGDEDKTPLLEAENSTNINSSNYNSTDSEKDALIITANN